jgi:hypothetical protein
MEEAGDMRRRRTGCLSWGCAEAGRRAFFGGVILRADELFLLVA